ncbi:conserved domain protein [Candidatus Vecturithrix granuli]|uniref:RNA-binding protein KhpA n=1 Tax=Vecturithrix granuli TaxID=1499967 RepID=A0A081BZX3_VECG1|nr:conserved domain protein [Candidatus Vecturithrix granuli]
MKELIEYVVKLLVDKTDEVTVTEIHSEKTTVIELRVAQSDIGKIIGKQGKTARALRTILNAAGRKIGSHCILEIVE